MRTHPYYIEHQNQAYRSHESLPLLPEARSERKQHLYETHLLSIYCFCWFKGKYLRASKTGNRFFFGIKILGLGRSRLRCLTSQGGNPLLPKNVPLDIQIGLEVENL